MMEKKRALSSDSNGLGPLTDGVFAIGAVSEVNGPGTVELPEFVLTKHELKQLVKYWLDRALECEFQMFDFETGSTEVRVSIYARRRINRAAEILSEREIHELTADAEREFRGKYEITNEVWNEFKTRLSEGWEAYLKTEQAVFSRLKGSAFELDPPEQK